MLFMDIHISTMWIEPYDQMNNIVDIYRYSVPATSYPYVSGYIIGTNPNIYTNDEIVIIDGMEVAYSVDFSGASIYNRQFGDGGGTYCPGGGCRTIPWPHCKAFWHQSLLASLGGGCEPRPSIAPPLQQISPDGIPAYPQRLLGLFSSPVDASKAALFNTPNAWNTLFSSGYPLIENDGPEYGEPGGYEYLMVLGHPVTTNPCRIKQDNEGNWVRFNDQEFQWGFLDPDTNEVLYREFICYGRIIWDSSSSDFYENVESPTTGSCAAGACSYTDPYTLYFMKPGQEKLPRSIKRYKVLKTAIPDKWPTYSVDTQGRVGKAICAYNPDNNSIFRMIPDRKRPEIIFHCGIIPTNSNRSGWASRNLTSEGDDGGLLLTITKEEIPESIFIGWSDTENFSDGGGLSGFRSRVPYSEGQTPCSSGDPINEGRELWKVNSDNVLIFNTNCDPAVFNPERISGYDPNDPWNDPASTDDDTVEYVNRPSKLMSYVSQFNNINAVENNLPKIVTYSFPGILSYETPNIGNVVVSDATKKYPLKEYPHKSRQSINSLFKNSNIVDFGSGKNLQAAELNEIQESFYEKQSILIELYNKWLTKSNLTINCNNILGALNRINSSKIFDVEFDPTESTSTCNILPKNKSSITKFIKEDLTAIVTVKADDYIMTYHKLSTPRFPNQTNPDGTPMVNRSIGRFQQFFNLIEAGDGGVYFLQFNQQASISIDLNELEETREISTEDGSLVNLGIAIAIYAEIDIANLISCNEYSELRDNANSVNNYNPCGAKRNVLVLDTTNIKSSSFYTSTDPDLFQPPTSNANIANGFYVGSDRISLSVDSINAPKFILAYAMKKNDVVTLYYANGIPIE